MKLTVTMSFEADARMFPEKPVGLAEENVGHLLNEAACRVLEKKI